MTTETHSKDLDKEKQRRASTVSGGIFLICLGVLLYTGWWWPGIMFAIGLSTVAELVFRGKTLQGIGTLALFCAIPGTRRLYEFTVGATTAAIARACFSCPPINPYARRDR